MTSLQTERRVFELRALFMFLEPSPAYICVDLFALLWFLARKLNSCLVADPDQKADLVTG